MAQLSDNLDAIALKDLASLSVRFSTASSARIYHIENTWYFPLGGRKMRGELEKEIERLNALLAIEDDAIMHLRERLLEAHSDA